MNNDTFYTLDRFEDNDYAVLVKDNGETLAIKTAELPEGSRVGNVYSEENRHFRYEETETETRRKRILERKNRLFAKLKNKQ